MLYAITFFITNHAFLNSWLYSTRSVVELGRTICTIIAETKRGKCLRDDKNCAFVFSFFF